MSAQTPGPWKVLANGHCVVAADGGVAMCGMMARTLNEAEANARLIAAAPDLLAALQEAESRIPKFEAATIERVRAAIAKATTP